MIVSSNRNATASRTSFTGKAGSAVDRTPVLTIFLAVELFETEIEKRCGIRPFVRAMQQDQIQFVAVTGGRRGKGVSGAVRPARLGRPHAGIHAQEFVVVLQRLRTSRRLQREAGRATNFAQVRYRHRGPKYF